MNNPDAIQGYVRLAQAITLQAIKDACVMRGSSVISGTKTTNPELKLKYPILIFDAATWIKERCGDFDLFLESFGMELKQDEVIEFVKAYRDMDFDEKFEIKQRMAGTHRYLTSTRQI